MSEQLDKLEQQATKYALDNGLATYVFLWIIRLDSPLATFHLLVPAFTPFNQKRLLTCSFFTSRVEQPSKDKAQKSESKGPAGVLV